MKLFLADAGTIAGAQFLSSGVQLAVQAVCTRLFTPDQFGAFLLAASVCAMAEAVFIARNGELAMQFVGNFVVGGQGEEARRHARFLLGKELLQNAGLALGLTLLALAAPQKWGWDPLVVGILSLSILFQTGYGLSKSLFIAHHLLLRQARFEILSTGITCMLSLVGAWVFGIVGLALGGALGALLKNLIAYRLTQGLLFEGTDRGLLFYPIHMFFGKKPASAQLPSSSKTEMLEKSFWKFSLHSFLRNFFSTLSGNIDTLILGAFAGPAAAASYKIAKSLAGFPFRLVSPIWTALRPRIQKAVVEKSRLHLFRFILLPSALIFLSGLMVFPFLGYARPVITAIYGRGYLESMTPLAFLLVGGWILNGVTSWMNFWIIIAQQRAFGTALYGVMALGIAGSGFYFGRDSAASMALAVAVAMGATALFGWAGFLLHTHKNLS